MKSKRLEATLIVLVSVGLATLPIALTPKNAYKKSNNIITQQNTKSPKKLFAKLD